MGLKSPLIKTLGALNAKSEEIDLVKDFTFSLRGAWVGTVTLWKRYAEDPALQGEVVDTFTANTVMRGFEPEGAFYWFEMTAYTSGDATGRLGQ